MKYAMIVLVTLAACGSNPETVEAPATQEEEQTCNLLEESEDKESSVWSCKFLDNNRVCKVYMTGDTVYAIDSCEKIDESAS